MTTKLRSKTRSYSGTWVDQNIKNLKKQEGCYGWRDRRKLVDEGMSGPHQRAAIILAKENGQKSNGPKLENSDPPLALASPDKERRPLLKPFDLFLGRVGSPSARVKEKGGQPMFNNKEAIEKSSLASSLKTLQAVRAHRSAPAWRIRGAPPIRSCVAVSTMTVIDTKDLRE